MARERRRFSERSCEEKFDFEFKHRNQKVTAAYTAFNGYTGRRRVAANSSGSCWNSHHFYGHYPRPCSGQKTGHRGETRLPVRCGPREPSPFQYGFKHRDSIALFVDYIPQNLSNGVLRSIFSKAGWVADLFISKKKRPNRNKAFGFVRFRKFEEASQAILHLDGYQIMGSRLKVSMAKFNKCGRPFVTKHVRSDGMARRHNNIFKPALRDSRRYSDVLVGKKPRQPLEQENYCVEKTKKTQNNINIPFSERVDDMKEGDASVKDFHNGCQDTNGEDLHDDSTALALNLITGLTALTPPQIVEEGQVVCALKSNISDSVEVHNVQPTVKNIACKLSLKEPPNPREVAKFLGFYGPVTT